MITKIKGITINMMAEDITIKKDIREADHMRKGKKMMTEKRLVLSKDIKIINIERVYLSNF